MRNIHAYLLSVIWFAVPVSVLAGTLPQPGGRWTEHDTVNHGGFEQDPLIHHVAERWMGGYDPLSTYASDLRTKDRNVKDESDRERSRDSDIEDKGVLSYDQLLQRSFDSVNGHSTWTDPWWGRRSEGDPMIRELSREPRVR